MNKTHTTTLVSSQKNPFAYWLDRVRHTALVTFLRNRLQDRKKTKAYRAWIRERASENSLIDPSIEFIGHLPCPEKIRLEKNVRIERQVTIWLSNNPGSQGDLSIGTGTFVGRDSYLGAYFPVRIGKDVMIGAGTYITSGNHRFDRRDLPMNQQGFTGAPIIIEDDVWVGAHVVILPGVKIEKGAIVAAGSVVTKSIPAFQIWGGVPAKFIKVRP